MLTSMSTAGAEAAGETRSQRATDTGSGSDAQSGLQIGETLGRYQVRKWLGEGGMGTVYLARDVTLGRSVALKLIGGGRRADRFLREARAIARLNHPNIVQLYDFGEHSNRFFLALEYIEGDTLSDRASSGLAVSETLRQIHSIADALDHAHSLGVFHCDLKPGNVMVGRDGRVRVVDFGIARTSESSAEIGGTPDWMAPEQWEGGEATARTDSWALGLLAAHLLTGQHPLGADREERHAAARDPRRDASFSCDPDVVPAAVAELVRRALEVQPTARPSMAEWRRVLETSLDDRPAPAGEESPYPGLAAFDEKRARFYFGRESEIDELVERLRREPCLPIVGPSGSGKSSFLHAGVIPRLRAGEAWTIISFRPGADPIGELARHLVLASLTAQSGAVGAASSAALELQTKAAQQLRLELLATPALLAARLSTLATATGGQILLAVDQLEEAVTQCPSEQERAQFLQMLLTAADHPSAPVRVVLTVRDDFLGKIAGLRSLFVMPKLSASHLRRIITEPLARHRYDFDDPTIVDALLAEVRSTDASDLPLLQFACRTLWDGRDRVARRILRATYEEMGGVAGALAGHAERALAELSSEERGIARRLLLMLVDGTTRRSAPRARLAAVSPEADALLDRLLAARLLVQRELIEAQSQEAEIVLEIAHESLLQTWALLRRWVEESRDERRLLDELDEAASLWERRGRRSDDLWTPDDLATAKHRAAQLQLMLPERIQSFLAASGHHHRLIRRRRLLRYALAFAVLLAMSIPVVTLVARYLSRESLIRVNAGTVDLVLSAYDWENGAPRAVPLERLPHLQWKLFTARRDDPDHWGESLPAHLVQRISSSRRDGTLTERITAPGGTAFLQISGRGADGEDCAPSWIRIQAFPGYASSRAIERLQIGVPTCQASRADQLRIEAGPFIYGGPGEQPSRWYGKEADYTQPERELTLPTFFIDRLESSNARFAPYARMSSVTGYRVPLYSNDKYHRLDADPDSPVTEINAFEAEAFCHYLGKRLPKDQEWVKAFRGGTEINGVRNPYPRRLFPWGPERRDECVNQDGDQDGYLWIAPVDDKRFACGASPYGVLHLAGNVQEWIAREGQVDPKNPQHVMRGGGPDSPPDLEHSSSIFINHRNPQNFNYSIGFRCATLGEGEP